MYKNRITKWKLDKRNKESEALAIVRKKRQRDAVGKASEFHLRGRVVSIDHVHRYLKRKGMSIEDAIDMRAATPPELRCYTPDAIPQSPTNPEIFEAHRRILVGVRSYVLGSLDSNIWGLDLNGVYYVRLGATNIGALSTFHASIEAASTLLQQKSFQGAGQFLVRGSALIRDVLLEQNPQMLVKVFDMMCVMRRRGFIDCSNIFLNQLSNMAATVLPDMHPFIYIFKNLSSLGSELDEDIFANAWISFLDLCDQALGALSDNVIANRAEYIYRIARRRDPDVAEDQLRAIVEKCQEVHGSRDPRYAHALLQFAHCLRSRGRYTEAIAAAEEIIHCADECNFRLSEYIRCEGMEELAVCHYKNYDDDAAESILRQGIMVSSSIWGWQDGNTVRLLTRLERWLAEFGKHEEAAKVSEQVAETLRQWNDFV